MNLGELLFRKALLSDLSTLQEIRKAAFTPIFDSFRSLLGDTIFDATQAPNIHSQKEHLLDIVQQDAPYETYVAVHQGTIVGFVSMKSDFKTKVGEIGLNAVHPDYEGHGVGTAMYNFILDKMKSLHMKIAVVSTGGDASHAPALRAYEKAGFTKQLPSVWLCQEL